MPGSAAWDLPSHPSSRDKKILEIQELSTWVKNLPGPKKNPFQKSKCVPKQPLVERHALPPSTTSFDSSALVISSTTSQTCFCHFFSSALFQAAFADIVFAGALFVGQVAEFHGFDGSIHDKRRAGSRTQTQKEHFSFAVAPKGLHRVGVHDFHGTAKRFAERKSNPALSQVARIDERAVV
jgi:hypothetical protein